MKAMFAEAFDNGKILDMMERAGKKVIEAKEVTKAFGDRILYEHLNFSLPQGGIVGIIGPNGAGKTTLFRMIMGLEKPTSGSFEIGDTVKLSVIRGGNPIEVSATLREWTGS